MFERGGAFLVLFLSGYFLAICSGMHSMFNFVSDPLFISPNFLEPKLLCTQVFWEAFTQFPDFIFQGLQVRIHFLVCIEIHCLRVLTCLCYREMAVFFRLREILKAFESLRKIWKRLEIPSKYNINLNIIQIIWKYLFEYFCISSEIHTLFQVYVINQEVVRSWFIWCWTFSKLNKVLQVKRLNLKEGVLFKQWIKFPGTRVMLC
jgi:hypothetical protein